MGHVPSPVPLRPAPRTSSSSTLPGPAESHPVIPMSTEMALTNHSGSAQPPHQPSRPPTARGPMAARTQPHHAPHGDVAAVADTPLGREAMRPIAEREASAPDP